MDSTPVWNQKDLKPPPFVTYPCAYETTHDALHCAVDSLKGCVGHLEDDKLLRSEEYVLTRMIYRFKNCLRMHKVMGSLKNIKKCLLRYKEMNMPLHVRSFLRNLPNDQFINDSILYLPSQQMFHFFLTRMLGCGALLAQTSAYCIQTFVQARQQLSFGFYIPNMLVFASLVSRIRVLCLSSLQILTKCYQNVYDVSVRVKAAPVKWLPDNESLPDDMDAWLTDQGFVSSTTTSSPELRSYMPVEDDIAVSDSDHVEQDLELPCVPDEKTNDVVLMDLGEPLSRSSFNKSLNVSSDDSTEQPTIQPICDNAKKPQEGQEFEPIDTTVLTKIESVTTPGELLRFFKQAKLKALSEQHSVPGYTKLQKAVRQAKKSGPKKLDSASLDVLKEASSVFCKKVQKKMKLLKQVETEKDSKKKKVKSQDAQDESVALDIRTSVTKHFRRIDTTTDYLTQLNDDLARQLGHFSFKGQARQLSDKELRKIKRLSEAAAQVKMSSTNSKQIQKALIHIFNKSVSA